MYIYMSIFLSFCVTCIIIHPGNRGSTLGRVIPKTQKMVLDTALLNTLHYKVRIKGKVEQSKDGEVPFPTLRCSSY